VATAGVQPVRAILFDFGHTLVDFQRTQEALHEAYQRIRERIEAVAYMEVPELLDLIERVAGGVESLVATSYEERRMEELDITELFRETLSGIGFDLPPDVIAHIVALDHSAWSNSLAVEDEVVEVLRRLRADGYRMGLVSNMSLTRESIAGDVEQLGLSGFFDAAVFSSGFGVRKPDPRIFEEALHLLGAEPAETVFVGDRLHDDIGGAQAVGMRAVLTRQFRHEEPGEEDRPDAVIERMADLPGVLAPWNAA
jgi:putative hydrolase of the HAD superfamily